MIPILGGLPRAGSTLLSALLRQNPSVEVTPTGWLLGQVASLSQAYTNNPARVSWLDQEDARSRFHGAVRGVCQGYLREGAGRDARLSIEKGRGWLPWFETLEAAFGAPPRIILPVRDLRGVLSSMERRYQKNPELMDHAGGGHTVGARVQNWMQPSAPPLGPVAAQLFGAVERGLHHRCLVVRYEDLCREPMAQLERVYDYLGYALPPGVHSTEIEEPNREHDAVHGPFGDHELAPGPMRKPRGDDADVIGADVAQRIVADNAWYYRALYPEVMQDG